MALRWIDDANAPTQWVVVFPSRWKKKCHHKQTSKWIDTTYSFLQYVNKVYWDHIIETEMRLIVREQRKHNYNSSNRWQSKSWSSYWHLPSQLSFNLLKTKTNLKTSLKCTCIHKNTTKDNDNVLCRYLQSRPLINRVGSATSPAPCQAKNIFHAPDKMQLHDKKNRHNPHIKLVLTSKISRSFYLKGRRRRRTLDNWNWSFLQNKN